MEFCNFISNRAPVHHNKAMLIKVLSFQSYIFALKYFLYSH